MRAHGLLLSAWRSTAQATTRPRSPPCPRPRSDGVLEAPHAADVAQLKRLIYYRTQELVAPALMQVGRARRGAGVWRRPRGAPTRA